MGAIKKIPTLQRPDIYAYHDHRLLLKDWFEYLKKTENKFSFRSLAKSINASSSYFTMVLSHGARLSDQVLLQLKDHLKMNRDEHSFLCHLVHLNDALTLDDQKKAYQNLVRFRQFKSQNINGLIAHQYLSKWYNLAIREMAQISGFKLDPKWIQNKLERKVSISDVRDSLRFLVKNGYIVVDEAGKPLPSEGRFFCEGSLFKLALSDYYKQIYSLGHDSIYKNNSNERNLMSHTMAVSEEGYEKIKSIIADSIERINEVSDQDTSSRKRVYNVSMISFPYTKKGDSE